MLDFRRGSMIATLFGPKPYAIAKQNAIFERDAVPPREHFKTLEHPNIVGPDNLLPSVDSGVYTRC
jgi:hypothetical protein